MDMAAMKAKICRKCNQEKQTSEFYKHPSTLDKLDSKCKECARAVVTANRNANLERIRAYDRSRAKTPKRKAHQQQNQRNWRKKYPEKAKAQLNRHPEKRAARIAVGNAIRDGKLTKGPCEICGTTNKVQAHHHDYSKPLDVRWRCTKCHSAEHGQDWINRRKP